VTEDDRKVVNDRLNAAIAADQPKMSNGAIIVKALTEKDRADMLASRENLAEPVNQENSISADVEVDPLTGNPSFTADYKNKGLDIHAEASIDKVKIGIVKKFD